MAAFIAMIIGVNGIGIGKAKTKGVKLKWQQGMALLIAARIGGGGNDRPIVKLKSKGVGSWGRGGKRLKVMQGP